MADDSAFVITRTDRGDWNVTHAGYDHGDFTPDELGWLGIAIEAALASVFESGAVISSPDPDDDVPVRREDVIECERIMRAINHPSNIAVAGRLRAAIDNAPTDWRPSATVDGGAVVRNWPERTRP